MFLKHLRWVGHSVKHSPEMLVKIILTVLGIDPIQWSLISIISGSIQLRHEDLMFKLGLQLSKQLNRNKLVEIPQSGFWRLSKMFRETQRIQFLASQNTLVVSVRSILLANPSSYLIIITSSLVSSHFFYSHGANGHRCCPTFDHPKAYVSKANNNLQSAVWSSGKWSYEKK